MKNGEYLKKMRVKKGITQQELAKKIGLSIHTIASIEQNQRKGAKTTWEKINNYFDGVQPKKLEQKKIFEKYNIKKDY